MNSYQNASFYDFSHEICEEMTVFPRFWHKKTLINTLGTIERVGRRTSYISIGTHAGTHIDAPSHFIENGHTIDKLPLETFVGQGVVFDFTDVDPAIEISKAKVAAQIGGELENLGIFLNFNWGRYYNNPELYYQNQPWFSKEAAEFLVSLKPALVGYDMAMLDNPSQGYGCSEDSPIHKLFLENSIALVENAIFPPDFSGEISYSVVPLKLRNLDGSPVRFVGWRVGTSG